MVSGSASRRGLGPGAPPGLLSRRRLVLRGQAQQGHQLPLLQAAQAIEALMARKQH
jgi:hypothetical protein